MWINMLAHYATNPLNMKLPRTLWPPQFSNFALYVGLGLPLFRLKSR
jgi:hypothetical protein